MRRLLVVWGGRVLVALGGGRCSKGCSKVHFFQKSAVQMYCRDPANFTKAINKYIAGSQVILLNFAQNCSRMLEILKKHLEKILVGPGPILLNFAQNCSKMPGILKEVLVRPGPILLKSNSKLFNAQK